GAGSPVELDQVLAWVRFYLDPLGLGEALFADIEVLDGMMRLRDRDLVEFATIERLLRDHGRWTAFNRWCKSKAKQQQQQARQAQGAKDTRPRIEITCDEHIVVNQSLDTIKLDQDLFQRGNILVMVVRASSAGKKKGVVERPEGSVQIQTMPKAV